MKKVKFTTLLLGILGIFFGLSTIAWAGGGPAGLECCLKANNLGGTTPLKATAAVYYDGYAKIVDATIRIERSGMQRFYRVRITETDISAASDIDIFCQLFNPCSWGSGSNRDAVIAVVNEILFDFYGLEPDPLGNPAAELLISEKSISDTDLDTAEREIPGTGDRFMSVAEIAVYASEF